MTGSYFKIGQTVTYINNGRHIGVIVNIKEKTLIVIDDKDGVAMYNNGYPGGSEIYPEQIEIISAVFSTATPDELAFICRKFGVTSIPGIQPDTRQAVIYSPDGTPVLYFISHVPPVAVTVHDAVG